MTAHVQTGANQLAVSAVNATDNPSPAGAIGRLVVEFEQGEPFAVALDGTWKAANKPETGWSKSRTSTTQRGSRPARLPASAAARGADWAAVN